MKHSSIPSPLSSEKIKQEIDLLEPINYRRASGSSILSHAGTWEGDDLEECLELMYQTSAAWRK